MGKKLQLATAISMSFAVGNFCNFAVVLVFVLHFFSVEKNAGAAIIHYISNLSLMIFKPVAIFQTCRAKRQTCRRYMLKVRRGKAGPRPAQLFIVSQYVLFFSFWNNMPLPWQHTILPLSQNVSPHIYTSKQTCVPSLIWKYFFLSIVGIICDYHHGNTFFSHS